MLRMTLITALCFFFLRSDANTRAKNKSVPKIITVTVYSNGKASIGDVTVITANLASMLNRKLWSSYINSGKMVDSIQVKFSGQVLPGARGAALDAIIKGLRQTLNAICMKIYNALFDTLEAAKQDTITKQFPVLFQELHW
jgi:hypothetical protein